MNHRPLPTPGLGILPPMAQQITPEPWESWGIAARWHPDRGWHNPTDETP